MEVTRTVYVPSSQLLAAIEVDSFAAHLNVLPSLKNVI
jgi:hypothetical protein